MATGGPYPVMLITLDDEQIEAWARQRGLANDSLASLREVRELIQAELDRANANYAQVEQAKKFVILERDLSQQSGELTPTLKVKRDVVNAKYAGAHRRAVRMIPTTHNQPEVPR